MCSVVLLLASVNWSIDLADQPPGRAIKIDDEATDGVLAAKLEAVKSPVTYLLPQNSFDGCSFCMTGWQGRL